MGYETARVSASSRVICGISQVTKVVAVSVGLLGWMTVKAVKQNEFGGAAKGTGSEEYAYSSVSITSALLVGGTMAMALLLNKYIEARMDFNVQRRQDIISSAIPGIPQNDPADDIPPEADLETDSGPDYSDVEESFEPSSVAVTETEWEQAQLDVQGENVGGKVGEAIKQP